MLYDVLHAAGTQAEIDGLRRIARELGIDERLAWFEPGCGSGRYLRAAERRGIRVLGVDRSPEMIAYAQRRVRDPRRCRLALGDMQSADPRRLAPAWRFGLAFNTINTIRHLSSDAAVLRHLELVHASLRSGGVYVVGISLSAYGVEQPSEDVWRGARGPLRVTQVVQYEPPGRASPRRERVTSVLHIERPAGDFVLPTNYDLRTYDLRQWRTLVDRSPFEAAGCVDEQGRPIEPTEPGYALWLLRRGGLAH